MTLERLCHMNPQCSELLDQLIRDRAVKTVLEFGGGASTKFFSERVEQVYTVEHNKQWLFEAPNVQSVLTTQEVAYTQAHDIQAVDLVLIDGLFRPGCLQRVLAMDWRFLCIHDWSRDKQLYNTPELQETVVHCHNLRVFCKGGEEWRYQER